MGCTGSNLSPEQKEARKKSKLIDNDLHTFQRHMEEEVKILLLGPGESGKSTVFKQMKIISLAGGFSREELLTFRNAVFTNCITQMRVLINASEKLDVELANEESRACAARLMRLPAGGEVTHWTPDVGRDIATLWQDPGIKRTYDFRDREFQLNDSAKYFFDNIAKYIEHDYCPDEGDVLRARVRTTGIEEATFRFDDLQFRMLDVGGQRSERRKWIHCFEHVKAILFVVSLAEYDQKLRENDREDRSTESLILFQEICHSQWFVGTPFILFMNKIDLFEEKLKRSPLNAMFPEFKGGADYKQACEFMRGKYEELYQASLGQKKDKRSRLFPHLTCAVDTKNIEMIFNSVKVTVVREVLDKMGMNVI